MDRITTDGEIDENQALGWLDVYRATGGLQSRIHIVPSRRTRLSASQSDADEVCDGEDNDCDGQIDEDNPGGNILYDQHQGPAVKAYPVHRRTIICQRRQTPRLKS